MTFNKTVFIPVDPDVAFALITQPERLRRWKTVAARVDLRVGGEYRWTMVPGHSAAGTFTEIEPGKHVVFTWGFEGSPDFGPGSSTVSVMLDATEGGTNVRLVHEGLTAEQEVAHAQGWNHFLDRLVSFATTGDAGTDDWAAAPDPINPVISAEAGLAVLQRVLGNLTVKDRDAQTPCAEFTAHELADHLFGSIANIGKALGLDVVDQPNAAPEVRIADAAQPVLEAFTARGLDGTIDMGFAQLPATSVANILNLEFLVHAWDFAVASGQDLVVSPVLSDYVLGLARNTISPEMRGGPFATETLVAES
ncbi:MAG: TIGR03086 family metal-binding protein, partial [Cryobacterium sp.]